MLSFRIARYQSVGDSFIVTIGLGVAHDHCYKAEEKSKLQILQHSLGLNEYGQGVGGRNFFGTSEGSTDFKLCEMLFCDGLMTRRFVKMYSEFVYQVTDTGREYIAKHSPKPPKLSKSKIRYQWYREHSEYFDNFREFLRYISSPDGKRELKENGFDL